VKISAPEITWPTRTIVSGFNKLVMNDADLILMTWIQMIHSISIWNIQRTAFGGLYQKHAGSGLRVFIKDFNKLHPQKRLPAATN